ncbi:hypothetical protein Pmani_007084 [Petrolisthes manimaculis]|uniref:Uncharacterized protein n=1 Tax=Petrolisthes manimaculis TaxID=1843537 RepID=A0AAE1UF72_9EUCA|nr:hypothetical protein Pmani_007084 [Petrolisthes manimaculis]
MKTLIIAALCLVSVSAEPESDADPGYVSLGYRGHGGYGVHYGGGYGSRWKRSADPESAAEPEAEPEAEASFSIHGGYGR